MGSPDDGLTPRSLAQQIDFILEIDRLKSVLRRTPLLDRSRRENTAEHSWQIALNATPDAQVAATHVLDTEDLRDVLALL
jgi:putative hydrolase of HD superfamily